MTARAARTSQRQSNPATATRKPRKPREAKLPVPKVIIPDTAERQAAAALGRLQQAEAARGVDGSNGHAPEVETAAFKAPTKPPSSKAPVAGTKGQHDFDLDSTLKTMSLDFIQCRDFGHSWRPFHAHWVARENAYESQLRCQRCHTIRTRWLSITGKQLAGNYDYTDGYIVKGMGRLTGSDRDKIRLTSILNVIAPDTAED